MFRQNSQLISCAMVEISIHLYHQFWQVEPTILVTFKQFFFRDLSGTFHELLGQICLLSFLKKKTHCSRQKTVDFHLCFALVPEKTSIFSKLCVNTFTVKMVKFLSSCFSFRLDNLNSLFFFFLNAEWILITEVWELFED